MTTEPQAEIIISDGNNSLINSFIQRGCILPIKTICSEMRKLPLNASSSQTIIKFLKKELPEYELRMNGERYLTNLGFCYPLPETCANCEFEEGCGFTKERYFNPELHIINAPQFDVLPSVIFKQTGDVIAHLSPDCQLKPSQLLNAFTLQYNPEEDYYDAILDTTQTPCVHCSLEECQIRDMLIQNR